MVRKQAMQGALRSPAGTNSIVAGNQAQRVLTTPQVLKVMAFCVPDTNELSIQLHPDFRGRQLYQQGGEVVLVDRRPATTRDYIAAQMYDAFEKETKSKIIMKDVEAYQWSATFGPDPSKAGRFLIKVPNRPLAGKDRFSLIELE